MRLIEICTINGYRRAISVDTIGAVGELGYREGKSKAVIELHNGNTIFTDDTYDSIMNQIKAIESGDIEVVQPFYEEQIVNIEPEEEF